MNKKEFYKYFDNMMKLKDESRIETFYDVGRELLNFYDFLSLEIKLFSEEWHREHEETASCFQNYRDLRTQDILFETATKEFLEPDHSEINPIGRICTWALADIGTEKAKEYLKILSRSSIKNISEYAVKRLDKWEFEKHRKEKQ